MGQVGLVLLPECLQGQVGDGGAGCQVEVPEFGAELTEAGARAGGEHTENSSVMGLTRALHTPRDAQHGKGQGGNREELALTHL